MILDLIGHIPCIVYDPLREITMTMNETRLHGKTLSLVYCLGWHKPEDFLKVFQDEYRGEIADIDRRYSVEDVKLTEMGGFPVTGVEI